MYYVFSLCCVQAAVVSCLTFTVGAAIPTPLNCPHSTPSPHLSPDPIPACVHCAGRRGELPHVHSGRGHPAAGRDLRAPLAAPPDLGAPLLHDGAGAVWGHGGLLCFPHHWLPCLISVLICSRSLPWGYWRCLGLITVGGPLRFEWCRAVSQLVSYWLAR